MKYQVQIDMAEFGEAPLWQPVYGQLHDCLELAKAFIKWAKTEYGDSINFRIVKL